MTSFPRKYPASGDGTSVEAHRETSDGSNSRLDPGPGSQNEKPNDSARLGPDKGRRTESRRPSAWDERTATLGRVTSDRPKRGYPAAIILATSLSLWVSGTGCGLLEDKATAEAEPEPTSSAAPVETNASPPTTTPAPQAPAPQPPSPTPTEPPAPSPSPLSTAPFPEPTVKKPGGTIPGPLPAAPALRPSEEQWAKAPRSSPQKKTGKIDCFTKKLGDWVRVVCTGPLAQTPILNLSKGDFGDIVDATGETGVYYQWKAGQDIVLDWKLGEDKVDFVARWETGAPQPAAVGVFK